MLSSRSDKPCKILTICRLISGRRGNIAEGRSESSVPHFNDHGLRKEHADTRLSVHNSKCMVGNIHQQTIDAMAIGAGQCGVWTDMDFEAV